MFAIKMYSKVRSCRKQSLDVVTAIDRHDPIANLVSGTVQRNGQPNLQTFFTQFANQRH